jgi:CDP-glycerol glycerophosphotransferase (TagB/SpsB family)
MSPDPLRVAGRLARRARAGRPQVTAVVLARGREEHVQVTLDSARDQPLARLEIVVVVMDERLQPMADRAAAEDWRVRTVESYGSEWALARQFGAVAARAGWLLFLSPRQVLLPGAVTALLEARGGDRTVVVGQAEDPGASWARLPLLGRLLVPAELWGGALDDGEPDGQTVAVVLVADTYAEAGHSYAETRAPVLRDTAERARPCEKVENPAPQLSSRVAQDRSMIASLDRDELAEERAARATGALVRDLPPFVLGVEHYDEQQWLLLSRHVEEMVATAGDRGLAAVPVEDRVALWLAARGGREELTAFVAARRFAGGEYATSVEGGRVRADLDCAPKDVPGDVLTLGEAETPLRARVQRARSEHGELHVELFVGVRRVEAEAPVVRLSLVGQPSVHLPVEVSSDPAVTRWMAEPHQRHHRGVVHTRIPLSAIGTAGWELEIELDDRGVRRAGSVSGELRSSPAGVQVRQVDLVPGRLTITITAPQHAEPALTAPGQQIEGTAEGDQWVFDLTTDPWGMGRRPAPSGNYRLVLRVDGAEVPLALAEEVADRLPVELVDEQHRAAVVRGPHGELLLRLDPPLDDEEAGAWAQRRLQEAYREVSEPIDPRLVYFQAFLGQSPTDHPGAIQAELTRVLEDADRTDVRMLWAVADSSTRVPEGAEPVLLRSREWYDALARAQWMVSCSDLEPWFTRREGQQVLQTFHAYPSQAMGLSRWRARGLTPTHLDQMLRRTSGTWSTLLTPIPEMDRYYRDNYAFDGRIIAQGHPGHDSLVAPGHEQRREEARERLGIAPHQRAVLYAPTLRDDLATDFRRARALLHLDVAEAAHALGPDYVVLLRGHRSHELPRYGAHVVDVTTYPEINDLILASDVAVLDYSSLRFDVAVTGKPMVFLVPDLRDRTAQARGFLYDFARSAPGPLLDSTDEVVAALSDLPRLEQQWQSRLAQFNGYYNRLADGRAAQRVVAEFFEPLLRD